MLRGFESPRIFLLGLKVDYSNCVAIAVIKKFVAFLFLVVAFPLFAYAERVSFTFAYDIQEGFPSFMGEGEEVRSDLPGTYIEILRLVSTRVPIDLKLVRLPWERCKAYIASNQVDAINSSFKVSRELIGVFPKTASATVDRNRRITSDAYRLYSREASNLSYDSVSGLIKNAEKTIFAPLGYSIVDDLRSKGNLIVEKAGGVETIIKMLAHGRASGVIAHESQANFLISQHPFKSGRIVAVDPVIKEKDYFILISKKFYQNHPDIAEQIWNEIGKLRETHLPSIEKKYRAFSSHQIDLN